jgi:hypothetical protein
MEKIMKKITCLFITALTLSLFSFGSFAEGELKEVLTQKKQSKTESKSRRKKVQMCQECGKPEPQCECEGHHDDEKPDDEVKKEH